MPSQVKSGSRATAGRARKRQSPARKAKQGAAQAVAVSPASQRCVDTTPLAKVTFQGVNVHLPANACSYHVFGGVMVVDFSKFTGQLVLEAADTTFTAPALTSRDILLSPAAAASQAPNAGSPAVTSTHAVAGQRNGSAKGKGKGKGKGAKRQRGTPPSPTNADGVPEASNPGNSPSTGGARVTDKPAGIRDSPTRRSLAGADADSTALERDEDVSSIFDEDDESAAAQPCAVPIPASQAAVSAPEADAAAAPAAFGLTQDSEPSFTFTQLTQHSVFSSAHAKDDASVDAAVSAPASAAGVHSTGDAAAGAGTGAGSGSGSSAAGVAPAVSDARSPTRGSKRGRPVSPCVASSRTTARRVGAQSMITSLSKRRSIMAGAWSRLATSGVAPPGRWGHSAVALPGSSKVIMFGGSGKAESALGDTYVFDSSTHRWSRPPNSDDMPRQWHCAVVVPKRDTMLVFGGERDLSTGRPEILGELRTFDTAVNCWIPAVTSGKVPGGRSGLAAAVVQESLVVLIGGIRGRKWLNEVVVLDSESWRWSRPHITGVVPEPRSYHTATAVGDKIVVFGGNDGDRSFAKVHVLDTTTNTWHWEQPQILGAGPCARTGHTATLVADNTIAIVGGWDPNDESDAKPFSDVFLLDTESWEWTEVDTKKTAQTQRLVSPSQSGDADAPAPATMARVGHAAVAASQPGLGAGVILCGGRDADDKLLNDAVFLPLPVGK